MISIAKAFLARFWPVILIALAVWFGGQWVYQAGYDAREAELQLQHAAQVKQQAADLKVDVQEAAAVDTKLAEQGAQIAQQSTQVKAQLRTHLKPAPRPPQTTGSAPVSQPQEEPPHETLAARFGRTELDLGTVRLLDSAGVRPGADPGAAGPSDAEVQALADTPSGIDGAALAEHDAQVKAQYLDLAAKHDALVERLEEICRKHPCFRFDE